MWKALFTIFVLLSFTACTSMQVIQATDAAAVRQDVQPGDKVRVTLRDGPTYDLTVRSVTDTAIEGVGRDGQARTVPLSAIAKLEKQQPAAGSSKVWVVVGILAAVGLIVALASGGSDGGGGGY